MKINALSVIGLALGLGASAAHAGVPLKHLAQAEQAAQAREAQAAKDFNKKLSQDPIFQEATTAGISKLIYNINQNFTQEVYHLITVPTQREDVCTLFNKNFAKGAPILTVNASAADEALNSPVSRTFNNGAAMELRVSRNPTFFIAPEDLATTARCFKFADGYRIVQHVQTNAPKYILQ